MLLNMIEHFKCALDKGEYVARISMDISKWFDCLPHCLTICKMHAHRFSGMHAGLLQVIYINWSKKLNLVKLKVTGKKMNKGVSQGQILVPLNFNIHMNDIMYSIKQGPSFN